MKKDVNALIAARVTKAEEAFDLTKLAIEKSYWISAANRLYYTCFYLITALFAKHNILLIPIQVLKQFLGYGLLKKI